MSPGNCGVFLAYDMKWLAYQLWTKMTSQNFPQGLMSEYNINLFFENTNNNTKFLRLFPCIASFRRYNVINCETF